MQKILKLFVRHCLKHDLRTFLNGPSGWAPIWVSTLTFFPLIRRQAFQSFLLDVSLFLHLLHIDFVSFYSNTFSSDADGPRPYSFLHRSYSISVHL